ncbi:Blue copper oxidase CueO precursor [Aquisphaera giovannonii]|uniref:Blue copper oxidase CueO n=1 Tax=Aquisphaera giovannonii TaxID=406548 RepID=A0A5B9WGD0_9BACT|nr:multicopper oxidase domain-containing protein [Aquisphaera giovannonii]QEH38900.1 Blue copper oxidase CueO precursor [Aquisphaera giovannonii]
MPRTRPALSKTRPRLRIHAIERLEARINRSAFAEPVMLSSVAGTLEVTLDAHRSSQVIEVAQPGNPMAPGVPTLVDGFMTYAWTLERGSSSDGKASGDGYPSPTLKVNPGDTLIIHLENDLGDQPTNLHTHGLDISPSGNSDNVLLDVPPGMSNTYTYQIPADEAPGMDWYHPHRHEHVEEQVYRGLAGVLIIGQADSEIQQVQDLPTRIMDVQLQRIEADPATGRPTLQFPLPVTDFAHSQYTVNGQYMPDLQMTGPYEKFATLSLDPHDLTRTYIPPSNDPSTWNFSDPANQAAYYVAQDSNAFPRTVLKTRAAQAPGKRIVEIDSAPADGVTKYFAITGIIPAGNLDRMYTQPLIRLHGTGQGGDPQRWNDVALTSPSPFVDLSDMPVAQERYVVFSSDFSSSTPRFLVNGETFPNNPVFQPQLGTVEEWTIVNKDPVPHPLHIHMHAFQAMPGSGTVTLPDGSSYPYDPALPHPYDQDVFYIEPQSAVRIRIKWDDYLGEAVLHCHNLEHEDMGMMSLLNVIPAQPLAAAAPGPGGSTAQFFRLDANGQPVGSAVASVAPFGPNYRGGMTVAMADVNRDGVPDAIFGGIGRVVVRDGASNFTRTLADFRPRGRAFRGALNVAGGDLNGDLYGDIIIANAQGKPAVRAYSGRDGAAIAEFSPLGRGGRGGVSVAAADVDGSGRIRIVTAAGAGSAPRVQVWGWDLFTPIGRPPADPSRLGAPRLVTEFLAGPKSARGGLSVAAGYYDAASGGFPRIITASRGSDSTVTVWKMDTHMDAMAMAMADDSGAMSAAPMATDMAAGMPQPRVLARFRVPGHPGSRKGLAVGSINTPTGSLVTVAPDAKGPGMVQFFGPDSAGMPSLVGNVRLDGRGRGVRLGGS